MHKSPALSLGLLSLILLLSGCAVGNKYDYQLSRLPLPVTGEGDIGVSVTDSRPYVTAGDKEPTFVGLQRGGFGNPFNVSTQSGQPLVEDLEHSLAAGLSNRGYSVTRLDVSSGDQTQIALTADREGLSRIIILDVREWKSDIYMRLTLHWNLRLAVYDGEGQLLAESSTEGVEDVAGAKMASANSDTVRGEFERLMAELFGNPAIVQAL